MTMCVLESEHGPPRWEESLFKKSMAPNQLEMASERVACRIAW